MKRFPLSFSHNTLTHNLRRRFTGGLRSGLKLVANQVKTLDCFCRRVLSITKYHFTLEMVGYSFLYTIQKQVVCTV